MKNVDCATLRDEFRAGGIPSGPEVEAHLVDCAHCTELFDEDARVGRSLANGDAAPNADAALLWSGLEQRMASETGLRAWLRSRSSRLRLWLALSAAAVLIAVGALRLRTDWNIYPRERLLGSLALLVLAAVLCVAPALASLGRPRLARRLAVAVAVVGLGLPFVIGALPAPVTRAALHDDPWRSALACTAFGLALAIPFLGLLWSIERSDRISMTQLLLATAAGGLVANAALLLHCPIAHPGHLLLGHAGVGIVLTLLAAAGLALRHARS